MTPLPVPLGPEGVTGWRIDGKKHAETWDSGEGAFQNPARWNHKGFRMVYAALDPSTAILEVAVHKQFAALDRMPHVITGFRVADPSRIKVFHPADIPNPRWLTSPVITPGQRDWAQQQLAQHDFICLPSVVSQLSWNLLFRAPLPQGAYAVVSQSRLSMDTRFAADR